MAVGPLSDLNGYLAVWFPDGTEVLAYRLLYPKDYDADVSYPLVIVCGGSDTIYDEVVPVTEADNVTQMTSYTQIYKENDETTWWGESGKDAFVLIPQMLQHPEWKDWDPAGDSFNKVMSGIFGPMFRYAVNALGSLVDSILLPNHPLYDTSGTTSVHSGTAAINIDSDRVYMMGFSLGSSNTMYASSILSDVLAGIICAAGELYGDTDNYYDTEDNEYSYQKSVATDRITDRASHIPMLISVGQTDTFKPSLEAVRDSREANSDSPTTYFLQVDSVGHSTTSLINATSKAKYFVSSTQFDQQSWSDTASGRVRGMDWLFGLSRVSRDDPYGRDVDYQVGENFDFAKNTVGERTLHTIDAGDEYSIIFYSSSEDDNLFVSENPFSVNDATVGTEFSTEPNGIFKFKPIDNKNRIEVYDVNTRQAAF